MCARGGGPCISEFIFWGESGEVTNCIVFKRLCWDDGIGANGGYDDGNGAWLCVGCACVCVCVCVSQM